MKFGNQGWLRLYRTNQLRQRQKNGINAFDPEMDMLYRMENPYPEGSLEYEREQERMKAQR